MPKKLTIALLGNPNCGKTTVFNALTGSQQQVGNWAGVTVERQSGSFMLGNQSCDVVDLPGTYTLVTVDAQSAQDERIPSEFLQNDSVDVVINVIDAVNIERNLYLTLQALEQQLPIVIAINRVDLISNEQKNLIVKTLRERLGCAVVPVAARQQVGIAELKAVAAQAGKAALTRIEYPTVIEQQIEQLAQQYPKVMGKPATRFQLIRYLEGDLGADPVFVPAVIAAQQAIVAATDMQADMLIAKARYDLIETLLQDVSLPQVSPFEPNHIKPSMTDRVDQIICHRFLGIPIFLAVMYSLFFFAINIGGVFQDFFEITADALFVDGQAAIWQTFAAPTWLEMILVQGLGKGLSTVITFVPVIGAMFLALSFLEDSGYMARAAFVMDRLMRAVGLPGKSFVPMIIGFGCNVPAIMGARTLDNRRDRILAVMMSPFMSCGARLAIFTVFVAAFFPSGGQNIVFLLYLIGIAMAVLTGLLLKRTVLKGEVSPLILEMPSYQWPHWQSLWRHSWHRLRRFVINAGRLILPVCAVIGILNSINPQGQIIPEHQQQSSVLAVIGQKIVPIFEPFGIKEDNWPAAVGLFTGVLAKEVVIGTLNSLYAQQAPVATEPFQLSTQLEAAVVSIWDNGQELANAWQNPIAAKAPTMSMDAHAYGEMVDRFDGQASAFAYLLFVLLYFPCISATAAMVREVQKGWTVFSVCWTTGLAYSMAVLFYQIATFSEHPLLSTTWLGIIGGAGALTIWGIRYYGKTKLWKPVPTRIVLTT